MSGLNGFSLLTPFTCLLERKVLKLGFFSSHSEQKLSFNHNFYHNYASLFINLYEVPSSFVHLKSRDDNDISRDLCTSVCR